MLRRVFLKNVAVAAAVAIASRESGYELFAADAKKDPTVEELVSKITGGKEAKVAANMLVAPAIAENGLVVPLKVEVNHPMEEGNYVKAIHIYAVGNPAPKITSVTLSPVNGKAYFSTRTKLAKSGDVFALVELSDGTFLKDVKNIKVTIGGCG